MHKVMEIVASAKKTIPKTDYAKTAKKFAKSANRKGKI